MAQRRTVQLLPIFAGVAAVTLAAMLAVWWAGVRTRAQDERLLQVTGVAAQLIEMLHWISDAEAGTMGYLQTGNAQYMQQYQQARQQIDRDVEALEAGGLIDAKGLASLKKSLGRWIEQVEANVEPREANEIALVQSRLREDRHEAAEESRRQIEVMVERARGEASVLRQRRNRVGLLVTPITVAGALITLLFVIWNYRLLQRDRAQRGLAERDLAEGKARLEGIVASAMDAIISVDEQQRIVLFNEAAEKIFRCSKAEAIGASLDRFIPERFREIHRQHVRHFGETGQTRRTMGSPSMSLSGLRADGEEFPIDASISQVKIGGQKLFTVILRDITQRRRAEEELKAWHAELERRVEQRTAELAEANRELEAFGYSVSHDLRAPLRHVTGFVELLEKHAGARLDEKSARYVRTISEASRRMGSLIDDLLTLSRIGRTTLSEVEVDLGQLASDTIQQLSGEIGDRQIEWTVGKLPRVKGDLTLLRNVMTNLLSNSVKYTRTREKARIELGSFERDDEWVCYVRDNGVGFDPQFAGKLFGVFQRLHSSEDFEGTGIGLASVRRVIQRHGGRTWAEGAVDQGATFYFTLPSSRRGASDEDVNSTHSPGGG